MIVAILFNGLWQGALVVALTYAISKLLARRSATTRHALWLAALFALVAVPVATALSDAGAQLLRAFSAHSTHPGFTITLLPAEAYADHARGWFEAVAPWVVIAWALGAAIGLARLAAGFVHIEGIRRRAWLLSSAAGDVFGSREVAVPIVAGILRPVVVVPQDLPATLSQDDLRRVVEHERAHVRRRDPLWNLIQRVIEAALFFNPWVHIAGGAVSNEREAACDDWAVEQTGSADDYAVCLATLAQMLRAQKLPLLVAGAYRSRHALVARIERLCASGPRRLGINTYALGGTIVLFIAATLALQAFSPALALAPARTGIDNPSAGAAYIAAACADPNVDAQIQNAVAPSLPQGLRASGSVIIAVTIAPNGRVTNTKVMRSSGDAAIDSAVVTAARNSTYSPKLVSCTAVEGHYLFRADFKPGP
ncbi:MAG TPA: M56 family metallopeptidase [Candidatus Binatia bacterium]|nr:M56 family metallopeptidase [Candidatus Binatia bacterium]